MIRTENLCKRYSRVEAVSDLNLDVRAGTVFGFVGENGAGKTTTMSILATLTQPTSGRAYVGGAEVTADAAAVRRQIGYMPDVFGVYDDLTVAEYLEFYGTAYGVTTPVIEARRAELLDMVRLTDKADAYVNTLSRGMQQRLGVARCLMHDPQVLILDEPASGLDPRSRIDMREIVKGLRERGKTVLISSHILPELADMCDEIGIIAHGKLVACAAVEVVAARANGQRQLAFDLLSGGQALAHAFRHERGVTDVLTCNETSVEILYSGSEEDQVALVRGVTLAGYPLKAVREVGASLEDLFLRLTEEPVLPSGA
ncbi:MAG: ABC transporter ATP-binding protein [Firmicutes bacterium]|nr:ABC transporter ATP-binding protein [Bacillota bacterium]